MTFKDFVAVVDRLLRPYGVDMMPEQNTEVQCGWRHWEVRKNALLSYDLADIPYPVKLGFGAFDADGVWILGLGAPQMPYPLQLDNYGARTAAKEILRYFEIENDLSVTGDVTQRIF